MSKVKKAYTGCDIFDAKKRHKGCALLIDGSQVSGITPADNIPPDYAVVQLERGLITPGFVDLQVNGGGGEMFNDETSVETIRTILDAHLPFGTTSLLATLITDTPEKSGKAIAAVRDAKAVGVAGIIGLHLEGPHLSIVQKGAHDSTLIHPMSAENLEQLILAAGTLDSLLVTVAPESVSNAQIASLDAAGVIVSLGHTNTSFSKAEAASKNGVTCVTHLFNAMSQLSNREPGLVGAALHIGRISASLIADGFHVDPVTITIALKAKRGPGTIFLVTDAMSTIGSDQVDFTLNGRHIKREGGRLTLPDGTLAGANLDMITAVRFMIESVGLDIEEAVRMATIYPAQVLGREKELGQLCKGAQADFILLNEQLNINAVWRAGVQVHTKLYPS